MAAKLPTYECARLFGHSSSALVRGGHPVAWPSMKSGHNDEAPMELETESRDYIAVVTSDDVSEVAAISDNLTDDQLDSLCAAAGFMFRAVGAKPRAQECGWKAR